MKRALAAVRDAETALERALAAVGARHPGDHDVVHLTRTLRLIACANLDRLAPHCARYDAGTPDPDPDPDLTGDLLHDLRSLHLLYAAASIDYVILAQGAAAARDRDLIDVIEQCHTQTLRGMRWTVTRLKTAAPQVLTSP